jgi:hypothetical protein
LSDNSWLVAYVSFAVIGTAEFLSSRVAKSFSSAQANLANALSASNPSQVVARILRVAASATMSTQGRPIVIVILIALAIYSGARVFGDSLFLPVERLKPASLACPAVSLLFGVSLSTQILVAPQTLSLQYKSSLFATVVSLGVRSILGLVVAFGAAGFSGFICYRPLGAAGWLPAALLAVAFLGWAFFFVAKELLSFGATSSKVTSFSEVVQRWMRRIFLTLASIGTALFIVTILRSPSVTILDQVALLGVSLPAAVAVLVMLGSVVAILAAWSLSVGVFSAELVVRKLVENKLNVGYTLLGLAMFAKEIAGFLSSTLTP